MLAAISVLSLLLGYLSLGPVGFQTTGTRIPMLYSVFGVEGRWFGPFGNENFAGPAGALVMVTGMLLRNSWRWALLSAGVLILLLSQARNSVLAIAIAGTYLTLTSQMVRNSAHRHALQWAASGGVAAATIGYILLRDPTMNGRIPIWQDFVEMWQSNPIQGVGDSGIREYVDTGGHHAVVALTHAHSSFLDILTRYGFVLFLGTIAVLILASRNSLADARRGNRASATILILLIVP
jgi:O-antigen ligase